MSMQVLISFLWAVCQREGLLGFMVFLFLIFEIYSCHFLFMAGLIYTPASSVYSFSVHILANAYYLRTVFRMATLTGAQLYFTVVWFPFQEYFHILAIKTFCGKVSIWVLWSFVTSFVWGVLWECLILQFMCSWMPFQMDTVISVDCNPEARRSLIMLDPIFGDRNWELSDHYVKVFPQRVLVVDKMMCQLLFGANFSIIYKVCSALLNEAMSLRMITICYWQDRKKNTKEAR